MYYRNLYKTIEHFTSRKFNNEIEMLQTVLRNLVRVEEMSIIGGRLWVLSPEDEGYRVGFQVGKMEKIEKDFLLRISEYPVFEYFPEQRTILRNETHPLLLEKGIFVYAATGIGRKVNIKGKPYYEYILAVNSPQIEIEFKYAMNIIASTLTAKLREVRSAGTRRALLADIDNARQLQQSILPQHEKLFCEYEMYGATIPAEYVGGDFFDYLEIGENKEILAVALGDAASKGVAAAAEAMYISGALRMASAFEIKITSMMTRMNRLVNMIFADDKFTSLFYGELTNDKSGIFYYANAGHNPPFFYKKKDGSISTLNPTGPILGPAPHLHYTQDHIRFRTGDVLVIYSDGVVESADKDFQMFEDHRLIEIIKKYNEKSAKEIALLIIEAVQKFCANGKYSDDKTVIVIKRVKD